MGKTNCHNTYTVAQYGNYFSIPIPSNSQKFVHMAPLIPSTNSQMSFKKTVTLECDRGSGDYDFPDDRNCTETFEYHKGRAMEARRHASEEGWIFVDSKDYCPHCAKHVQLASKDKTETMPTPNRR